MHALVLTDFGTTPAAGPHEGLILALPRRLKLSSRPSLLALARTASGGAVGMAAAVLSGHPALWITVGLGLGVMLDRIAEHAPEHMPSPATPVCPKAPYRVR